MSKRRPNALNRYSFLDGAMRPCDDPQQLRDWLELYCGLTVPTRSVCPHHDAPFEYVKSAYFEPADDLIVWAPRGGGKTRLGAAATLLDLLHKPGVAVRILGGSLVQSLRMWEHLEPDLQQCAARVLDVPRRGDGAGRAVRITHGSSVAVLTQSQRAVRGLRVQKLRCDEVELFDPDVWESAQAVTRSIELPGGKPVRASIEALSTLHKPYGLMAGVIDKAQAAPGGARIIRWCILDVLQRCPIERSCDGCDLRPECKGAAKFADGGHFSIDDAIAIKRRVSVETWEAEMLCKRPSQRGCVFGSFDEPVHVLDDPARMGQADAMSLAIDFGYASPLVCLWIVGGAEGEVYVIDEYVQPQRTLEEHLEHIEARRWGKVPRVACDPAGNGRNDQTAASNVQLLRSRGYLVKTRRSLIQDGLEMIRAALRPASGNPTLFIHPRCARLIKALRGYHYAETGSELPVKDGEHDHLIDALRYWFVNRKASQVQMRVY